MSFIALIPMIPESLFILYRVHFFYLRTTIISQQHSTISFTYQETSQKGVSHQLQEVRSIYIALLYYFKHNQYSTISFRPPVRVHTKE